MDPIITERECLFDFIQHINGRPLTIRHPEHSITAELASKRTSSGGKYSSGRTAYFFLPVLNIFFVWEKISCRESDLIKIGVIFSGYDTLDELSIRSRLICAKDIQHPLHSFAHP